MRVLFAFDKFKDALTAHRACAVAAEALQKTRPEWIADTCPLTDGGDGFEEVLRGAVLGQKIEAIVQGPRGKPVQASFSLARWEKISPQAKTLLKLPASCLSTGRLAIIEMATASGLALLSREERDPWQTSTYGTGELIRLATEHGASAILLGVGGSATNDLGLGALSALGFRFLTSTGSAVESPIPAVWPQLVAIEGQVPPSTPPIRIACDVTTALLGEKGAAATYGSQKGLAPERLEELDCESARLASLLAAHTHSPIALAEEPGAGAAGGITFGLRCAARAELLPGFDLVAAWLDLDARIRAADIIVTGEGRFDDTSYAGKGPGAALAAARALGKPVYVFAGQVTAHSLPGVTLKAITPSGTPLSQALSATDAYLATAVRETFGDPV